MFPEVVKAICERDKIYQPSPKSLGVTADALHQAFMDECDYGLPDIPRLSEDDLMRRQVLWLKEWNICEMQNGLLHQNHLDQGRVQRQLALPKDLREMVLTCLQNDMGHLGVERSLDLSHSWFYWPRMVNAVEGKIRTVRRKSPCRRPLHC